MSLDATHDTRHDTLPGPFSRPGSEIQPVPDAPAVSRHPSGTIYEGSIIPAHSADAVAFHGQHPAYAPMPLHIAALHDQRHLPRPHPQIVEIIGHYHLWPALTTVGYSACGWWANLEPNHIWLMLPFLGGGGLFPVGSWLAHHFHGNEADRHLTHGLLVGSLVGFSGAAAVGAGFSGISAMASFLLGAVGTLGSIGWRRHTKQAAADAAVDWMEAAAAAPMPPAPVGTPALAVGTPVGTGIGTLSDEAARLHAAFASIAVEPIQVDVIRRLGEDAWMTYIYTPDSKNISYRWLLARTETLRNNLKCRAVQIIPTAIGNRWEIRVTDGEESALDEVHMWPGPNTDDITQPVNIGIDEALEAIAFRLKGRHTLYAGITDGGKSIGVNVIACAVASMKNAVMVLMDLKPGQLELGPYERVAYRAAFGIDDAALLLRALGAAMEERGQILKEERERTGKPVKEWDPNRHGPAIVLLMDELAEMMRLDKTLFELWLRLMQVARALGIYIIAATQSPSGKALGDTTDGSGQFTNVACYRTRSATQTNVILGQGAHGDGWRADETTLPLSGMFRPRTPEYPRPSVGRGYMITPERIMQVIEEHEDDRPALDERTAVAMEAILNGRCDPRNPGGPGGGQRTTGSPSSPPRLRDVSAPRYPDKTEVEPEFRDIWALFCSMGSATVKELMAYRLPTFGSRDRCTTALTAFKAHLGAISERDADGRSERFVCTVPAPRSKEA